MKFFNMLYLKYFMIKPAISIISIILGILISQQFLIIHSQNIKQSIQTQKMIAIYPTDLIILMQEQDFIPENIKQHFLQKSVTMYITSLHHVVKNAIINHHVIYKEHDNLPHNNKDVIMKDIKLYQNQQKNIDTVKYDLGNQLKNIKIFDIIQFFNTFFKNKENQLGYVLMLINYKIYSKSQIIQPQTSLMNLIYFIIKCCEVSFCRNCSTKIKQPFLKHRIFSSDSKNQAKNDAIIWVGLLIGVILGMLVPMF